jgi:hypothetical protein
VLLTLCKPDEKIFIYFADWLHSQGRPTCFEEQSVAELADTLRQFYASVRNVGGQPYTCSALTGIRAALQRYLTNPPHNREINLVTDEAFRSANKVVSNLVCISHS